MSRFIFASMAHNDKLGYAFDSMAFTTHRQAEVDPNLLRFDTYGDGLTAHSPDSPITRDLFVDYCYSLAEHLQAHPELADVGIAVNLNPRFDHAHFEFASQVKHSGKARWYSLAKHKISSSESKRNDRRYEPVPDWADGSYLSTNRLLWSEYDSFLRTFARLVALHDWWGERFDDYPAEMPGLGDIPHHEKHEQRAAWLALQNVFQALEALRRAKGQIDSYRQRVTRTVDGGTRLIPAEEPGA